MGLGNLRRKIESSGGKLTIEPGPEKFIIKVSLNSIAEGIFGEVITRTLAGETVYPDAPPLLKIGQAKSIDFTKRELEVLREKINGFSNQEICQRLAIKKSTLDYHINNILSKTGYPNVLRLSMDVVEQKFIIPDF